MKGTAHLGRIIEVVGNNAKFVIRAYEGVIEIGDDIFVLSNNEPFSVEVKKIKSRDFTVEQRIKLNEIDEDKYSVEKAVPGYTWILYVSGDVQHFDENIDIYSNSSKHEM